MKRLLILLFLVPNICFGASLKLSDLTELSEAPANDDIAIIVDISDTTMAASGTNKKITIGNFFKDFDAATGDSATAFFDAGTIEHEYGGLEADVSAYSGLIKISGGATSQAVSGTDYLTPSDIDDTPSDGDTSDAVSSNWAYDEQWLVTDTDVAGASYALSPDGNSKKNKYLLDNSSDVDVTLTTASLETNMLATDTDHIFMVCNNDSADSMTLAESANVIELKDAKSITIAPSECSPEFYYTGTYWTQENSASQDIVVKSVETPSYAHFANADAQYSDNTTPHVLLDSETKNSILTNYGATEDRVYTLPAYSHGMNFMFMVGAAYQVDLEPPSGDNIILNGTAAANDEHIINAADTEYDLISCFSVEESNGVYQLVCKTDNSNWAEASP